MIRFEALRLAAFLSLPLAASLGLSSCCALFEGAPPASSGTTASEEPAAEADDWYPMPEPGPVPSFDVPEAVHFELSNGIPVTFVRYGDVPLVNLRINLGTGSSADPVGKSGLASFTADM